MTDIDQVHPAEAAVEVTADEAARRIREMGLVDGEHKMSPEDRHRANFVGRVCDHLGIERTVENFAKVTNALNELGVEPHAGHEYPKYVPTGRKEQVWDIKTDSYVDGKKDELVIANDETEEADIKAGKLPGGTDLRPNPEAHTDVPTAGLIPTKPEDMNHSRTNPQFRNVEAAKMTQSEEPKFSEQVVENAEKKAETGYQNAGAGKLDNPDYSHGATRPAPKAPQRRT